MSYQQTLRVIRLSAAYDLVVTAGFAFFFTAPMTFALIGEVHGALDLSGSVPDGQDSFTLMFANLMGSLVLVWGLYRLVCPSIPAGLADVAARLLFSLGMSAALVNGGSPVIVGFLVLEIIWALVQAGAIGLGSAHADF